MMDPGDLLTRALAAPPDSAERILYGTAAFAALIDADLVLVGGGAQVTHTGIGRLTDIDVIATITGADEERLVGAGFRRQGRHWVVEAGGSAIAVEIPAAQSYGEEPPEVIDVEGVLVSIISVTDLMMDRLIQATDGTVVTRDEALQLAVAAYDRIDWERLGLRASRVAASEGFLRGLPALAQAIQTAAARLSDA